MLASELQLGAFLTLDQNDAIDRARILAGCIRPVGAQVAGWISNVVYFFRQLYVASWFDGLHCG